MITKFKIYEGDSLPEVGDYVILNPDEIGDIAENKIGEVVHVTNKNYYYYYYIYYSHSTLKFTIEGKNYNVMFDISKNKNIIDKYFLAWSTDKDKLEMILQANKYNL